jgi:hypothetical protein
VTIDNFHSVLFAGSSVGGGSHDGVGASAEYVFEGVELVKVDGEAFTGFIPSSPAAHWG